MIHLRLLLSFFEWIFREMIPSCVVNANPTIKQRVSSLLRMFKTYCWFLIFSTKRAAISNKRSRPSFLFFILIGWLMTVDCQPVNRTSLSYFFFMKLILVPSISINSFLVGYSSRLIEQEKTHRWLIVLLQISSLSSLSFINK